MVKISTFPEPTHPDLASALLRFEVSHDLEHVCAELMLGTRGIRLGARVHWATLHQLALVRKQDRQAELPSSAQGWVYADEFESALRLRPGLLNVHVHRARRQLLEAGVPDADAIVERRRLTRQLRIGLLRLSFVTV